MGAREGAPPVIEVFADVLCPFAHVGLRAVAAHRHALGRDDVCLRVRAWPLELVNVAPLDPGHTAEHVADLRAQVAPGLFAGFDADRFPRTSLPALTLAASAYRAGDATGEAVSFAVRDALFEDGQDISAPGVLDAIACRFGVPAEDEAARASVLADWEEGCSRGVKGSPHFFCGTDDVFCPALRITRGPGGRAQVEAVGEVLDRFLRGCLRAA